MWPAFFSKIKFMANFSQMSKRIKTYSKESELVKILAEIFAQDFVHDFIIQANQRQLAEKGETKTGKKLQTYKAAKFGTPYTPFTIRMKLAFGQGTGRIVDHVTLFQTGAFYRSMQVISKKMEAVIKGETGKFEENIDVEGVMGLNNENMSILIHRIIKPHFIARLKTKITHV